MKLLACRVCLITDIKLFDMFKYKLAESYETITGSQLTIGGLPHHVCSICATLLQKTVSFKNKCDNAEKILKHALKKQKKLTTAYLRTIDRSFHSLNLPLTVAIPQETCKITEVEVSCEIKKETTDNADFLDSIDNVSVKDESDEEPLSKTVKRKVKKKDIEIKNEVKLHNDNNINNDNSKNEAVDETDWERLNDIQIVALSKEEQIEEVMARKNSPNYLNSFYKCDECFKGFLADSTYKNHMAKHSPRAGAHACDVCRTRWPTPGALRVHIVTSHERKYVCRKCNHVSNSSHGAKEHSNWHFGFKYTCKVCGATFSKSSSHLTHLRLQHPSDHCCELCGDSFIGKNGLAMHRKKAHRDQISPQASVKCEGVCSVCGAQFKTLEALERHGSAGDSCNTLRPCLSCGEGFSTEELLKEHSKTHLKGDSVKCEQCNRTFAHRKSLSTHYHRAHLRDTSRLPAPAARAVCEQCGKRCVSAAALRYHQRAHSGERPHACGVCAKRFAMPGLLQIHMRTHTGERPYACPQCPKAFSNRAALVRHNRVHTGVKPYPCPECGKRFTQSNSRKLHVSTVHLKLPAPHRARRARHAPADERAA